GSTLYYLGLLQGEDPGNQFAQEMRDRVRKILHQTAQAAVARADFAQAQEIYASLIENYPRDEEAKQGQIRMESQLSEKRPDIRELIRKAEDALHQGHLADPQRSSAYYFARQVLAIDRMNDRALGIKREVADKLVQQADLQARRGDTESAIVAFQRIVDLFPDDRNSRARLDDLKESRKEDERAKDPVAARERGLKSYRDGDYAAAIKDLELAMQERGGPEVIFSLARSYEKIGQLDRAVAYYNRVQESDDESYRSAKAALGDIFEKRGDINRALDYYK